MTEKNKNTDMKVNGQNSEGKKLSAKKLTMAQARNSSDRHKKEWKVGENIIMSPSIAPGIKIIE